MPLAPVNPKRRRWTLLGLAGFVVLAFAGAGVPQAGGCGGDQLRETGADEDELSDGGPSQRTSGGAGAALDGGLGASADAGAEAADDAGSGPIGRTPNPSLPRCDSFVYIDDGAFKLAGKPFALKGDNYRVELVALQVDAHAPTTSFPRVTVAGQTYDLFLAPSGQYQPDNNSWCRDPPAWNPDMRCCADGASCMAQLDADVARVQALGATTVRLLIDNFHFDANNLPRFDTGRIPYLWAPFSLDLQDPAQRKAVNHLILQAVQKLGAKGVRSVLLLNGKPYYKDQATQASWFKTFVGDLAATLKDEPWLVGYDFDNEPSWSSGAPQGYNFSIDKLQMRDLVQSWVDAVRRAGDTHHLTTLGNAHLLSSVDDWDPTVLPIDFNSYHVYPIKPKDQLRWPDVKDWIQREAFYASLGGCGMKCPYLGTYDGANCKVAEGPVMSTGVLESDGIYFKGRSDACPAGRLQGDKCLVASLLNGRDHAFQLPRDTFYLSAQGGRCPANTSFDGANCVVAQAPLGASTFVWNNAFYYKYLSGPHRCAPPASDDGANCYVAAIPSGWHPFTLTQPIFYTTPVTCGGGRIPYILGETSFSVNLVDDTTGAIVTPVNGTPADQAEFLRNEAQTQIACGYQGYLWWQHGDVHWGDPVQDHMGLWADWRQLNPGKTWPEVDAVAMRPAGAVLRDELDFTQPKFRCDPPSTMGEPWPLVAHNGYRYLGKVLDQGLHAVPFAQLKGTFTGGLEFSLMADGNGAFSFVSPRLVTKLDAGHFGHEPSRNHYPVPLVPLAITLHKIDASELPAYHPPSEDAQSCRVLIQ